MKNILKNSVIALSFLFLLTGCSKSTKTLTCTMSDEVDDKMSLTQTIVTKFDNDTVTNIDQNIKMTVKDDYVSYIEQMAEGVRNQYADIKDKDGIVFDVKVNGNVIDTTLNAELSKLDDASKKKLNVNGSSKSTYEEGKKSLEQAGYTCK